MTLLELAQKLDGREYGSEITIEEAAEAKKNHQVVVFGASDDLIEFRGAIDDELGAYNGTTAHIDSRGLVQNRCEDDECPYFAEHKNKSVQIKALWCPKYEDLSWAYETEIPHATFNVMDDGELYCRGIVFSLDNLGERKES